MRVLIFTLLTILAISDTFAFTNITGCGVLSTNSETYNLTTNLSINGATCLTVNANNAVLYCNGFPIIGNNTNQTNGVSIVGSHNNILGCNSSNFTNAFNLAGQNNTINGATGRTNMGSGAFGTVLTGSGANNIVINSTFYAFPTSYVAIYTASMINFSMRNSTVYNNGSNGAVYGFQFNQTYINNTIITNQSFAIQVAGGAVLTSRIENNSLQVDGAATGLSIFSSGTLTYNNRIFGTSAGARISVTGNGGGSGIFVANNVTCQTALCVSDLNGSNRYNGTYMGINQGNLWQNVINGTVLIRGAVASSFAGLYVGTYGVAYPYNNTTSLGKFSCNFAGCADYAPISTYGTPILPTTSISPNGGQTFYRNAENITISWAAITNGTNMPVRYSVYYSSNSGGSWNYLANTTSTTHNWVISALSDASTYRVLVFGTDNVSTSTNVSSLSDFTITTDAAPSISRLEVSPQAPDSNSELTCFMTATDAVSSRLNVTVWWYKNGANQTALASTYLNYAVGGYSPIGNISPTVIGVSQNWSCAAIAFDGVNYSAVFFSQNVTIRQPPCVVTLLPTLQNSSQNLSSTVVPENESYVFNFTDSDFLVLQSGSSPNYTINASFNQTRIYVIVSHPTGTTCSDYSLVLSSQQQAFQNDFIGGEILTFFNASQSIILAFLGLGVAYAFAPTIGYASVAASIIYMLIFVLFGGAVFLYVSVPLFIVGLVLVYAKI